MQLLDQLVSRSGAIKATPDQSFAEGQANQAALFQVDLDMLEGAASPVPLPDLPTQSQPLPKPAPEKVQIDGADIAPTALQADPPAHVTLPVISAEPKMQTPPVQPARATETPAQGATSQRHDPPRSALQVAAAPVQNAPVQKAPAQNGLAQNTLAQKEAVEGHEKPLPAKLVSHPDTPGPKQDALPKAQIRTMADMAKPEPPVPQASAKQELSIPSVQVKPTQAPQTADKPVRLDGAPTSAQPSASPQETLKRDKATAPQIRHAEGQPAKITRMEAPIAHPPAPPAQPHEGLNKPSILQTASFTPRASAEPHEPRHLVPVTTPAQDTASRLPTAQASVRNVYQAAQAPLSVSPIADAMPMEAEPQIALSPVQSSAAPGSAAPAVGLTTTPAQTSHAVHQITAQIAAEVGTKSGRDIEVRLDPEELGRVRITVHPREAGMFIALAVERPETLELLRKNAGELMSNLQEFDLSGATFEFSQEGDTPTPEPDHPSFDEDRIQVSTPQHTPGPPPSGDGRLDLRL